MNPPAAKWAQKVIDIALEALVVPSFTAIGFRTRSKIFGWSFPWNKVTSKMQGKVVVVTGASGGIGSATAKSFALMGATVWLTGRNASRLSEVAHTIQDETKNTNVFTSVLDLSSFDDVKRFAEIIKGKHDHLDVLVHNAGALTAKFTETKDGNELTTQTHVLAPHLLTTLLSDQLSAAPDGHVIWTSSGGMYTKGLDTSALRGDPNSYKGASQYASAKRAQVVLAELWSERFRSSNGQARGDVLFSSMHPGWVDTPGMREALPTFYRLLSRVLRNNQMGADTLIWLGTQSDVPTGGFWLDRRRRWKGTRKMQGNESARTDLWDFCETAIATYK